VPTGRSLEVPLSKNEISLALNHFAARSGNLVELVLLVYLVSLVGLVREPNTQGRPAHQLN